MLVQIDGSAQLALLPQFASLALVGTGIMFAVQECRGVGRLAPGEYGKTRLPLSVADMVRPLCSEQEVANALHRYQT